jgi:hypothetical protein
MVFYRNRSDIYTLSELRKASKKDLINILESYHIHVPISGKMLIKKYYYDMVVQKLKEFNKISKSKIKSKSKSRKSKSRKSKSKINNLKKQSICKEITNISKYVSRPGPPYKAQDCKNIEIKGNNGKMYISLPNKNGVYRWVPVDSSTLNKKSTKDMYKTKEWKELKTYAKIWEKVTGRNQDILSASSLEDVKRQLKYYKSKESRDDLRERILEDIEYNGGVSGVSKEQVKEWLRMLS